MLLLFFISEAQTNFYYYKGNKVGLELDKSKINLIINNRLNLNDLLSYGLKDFVLYQNNLIDSLRVGSVEFISETQLPQFYQKINLLKSNPNVKSIGYYYKRKNTTSIGTSNLFYVKLKSDSDYRILQDFAKQHKAQIIKQVPYMPLWYVMSSNNPLYSGLELSNMFFESSLFANIDPAFMFNFRTSCASDPNFSNLWGLNNNANPNIDINVCQAWSISNGGLGVNVAIVDNGFQKDHIDLLANTHSLSCDAVNTLAPSFYDVNKIHGTHVAGIIGAIKNNSLQAVGVAPFSKLMSVSHPLTFHHIYTHSSEQLASGISWAYKNGADIINCSWGDYGGAPYLNSMHTQMLEQAILDAIEFGRNGKGSVVVFISGNAANNANSVDYPGNFDDKIVTVGAINQTGTRALFSFGGSGYGEKLDIVAPGVDILSTLNNNQFGYLSGTSMAAPHVSGVAALILGANPCLNGQQVRDIIEKTAKKVGAYTYSISPNRPNGTWNEEMGYGLVDAGAAVQMAISLYNSGVDLCIKDNENDMGAEPNTTTPYLWTSNNIWVRRNNDNNTNHQNPDYSPNGNSNYIKVRVVNKGCLTSTGTERLKLYWAKASSASTYTSPWYGGVTYTTGASMGDIVAEQSIPILKPGEEKVLTFPWLVPNPNDYGTVDNWHFCLSARIIATNDAMTIPLTNDLYTNVKNSNNLAWRNLTVVDTDLTNSILNNDNNVNTSPSGRVLFGNPYDEVKSFNLEITCEDLETGKPIYEEAEVSAIMNEALFNAWKRGGKQTNLLDDTKSESKKIVLANHATFNNILFEPNEVGTIEFNFNFLTKKLTNKSSFILHLIQQNAETGDIIGGETFLINKKTRLTFKAEIEDGNFKEADLNQPIIITAKDINESAYYNWYDQNGELIKQGKELQIAKSIAQKYKLEVIASVDKFKDYNEVEVKIKPSRIETIIPNPAKNNIKVAYKLNGAVSSYLMIIGNTETKNTAHNYILDVNTSSSQLNIETFAPGFYTIVLVVNGQIIDAKNLIKE